MPPGTRSRGSGRRRPSPTPGSGKRLAEDSGGKILDSAAVHLLTEATLVEGSATEARVSGGVDRVPVR
jgi:hypothetical protein